MPTAVDVARQCLAEAAAGVLDEAVGVARRRSHGQTTSLHIISALLALPSSTLREACARARSSACSPRLQLRALELSVGVALDRLPASKSSEPPAVSNSLMAAIKRSQANQRRHPDTFHLYQQQQQLNPSSISVELKHLVMSILDDPIVSRVLGDAGFRTHEIKFAILNPLAVSGFSPRPPPLFSCSFTDLDLKRFTFDENSRRIAGILIKSNRRNPLLVGVYASEACKVFMDCLKRSGNGNEGLPKEIHGLRVVSIEQEMAEIVSGGGPLNEEMMGMKFKQVDEIVGDGIILNCGNLKVFVDVESVDVVSFMISKVKRLLVNNPDRKLWLIGFLEGDCDYKKLVERCPSIETDWDLHILPITSTTTSIGDKCFKSSFMKSFVPLGGFFSMPSENESICTTMTAKSLRLCNLCNEKYEQEVSDVLKGVTTNSVADKQSINLSSWLQIAECETSKRSLTTEAKEDKVVLDASRVMALKRTWSDICRRLHCSTTSQEDIITLAKPHTSDILFFQNSFMDKDSVGDGLFFSGNRITNLSPCMPSDLQKQEIPPTSIVLSGLVNTQAKISEQCLDLLASEKKTSLPITNLTLGTPYDSTEECRRKPSMQEHYKRSESSKSYAISSSQVSQSSSWSYHLEEKMYAKDRENPWTVLAEKVYWQMEAIQTISRTVARCRNGNERHHCSFKGNVWLSFLGPDKVGKRKIASAVAEIVFGSKENLLSFDLNSQDVISPFNSIVDCYDPKYHKLKLGRKMIVDYLAEELSKHPHSVVLLENVEKADFLVQNSLSQAIKRGKFPDSHGREIIINNNVFVLASAILKVSEDLLFGKVESEFPEDTVLQAKNLQLQILVGSSDGNYPRNSTTNVSVTPSKIISFNKRKLSNNELTEAESKRACRSSRSIIDLNLPVEDMEEECDNVEIDDENVNSDNNNSQLWLEELLEHVDENVVFKPFDFDSLTQKILKEIDVQLKKVGGDTLLLEIDQQVMVHILAAAWLADRKSALEDWIEQVLCSSIEEAGQRCNGTSDVVMKLVHDDGLVVEATSGLCLPARINVT